MRLFSHVPAVTFKFVEAAQRKEKAYSDAIRLLRSTCNLIRTSTNYNNVIFEATRQNAVEFVKLIVSRFPNAIWSSNEDGHTIIQYAVINHSEKIYNLLYQMSKHKNIYRTIKDPFKNNLLHMAARLAPENKLNPILGAALKVQRELQWFKEVESFVCPLNIIQKNSLGETPQMVFTKKHKKLLIEGEKWMKEIAQSYTITATLITTIMFAAAITVPGGNKQDNGIPMFANISLFTIFAVSDVISFFTSVASLLMFLSIVTDSFREHKFLFKLPTKLIIGLFALVKNIISATYGRSMFDKKEAQDRKAEELYAAILNQDFGNVIDILDEGVVTLTDKITISSNTTALHVAVEGSTLLHVAAIVGNTEAAKILVERNQDLLYVKDNEERTPVN
ncbi:hypothetical protein E3N88_09770 [Mikania micrantha]|uniref:PGG domain-containing protein n=1 Tax=Mikania micrantha TaxID=192012 RepID=A0A5N6PK26_9ASTR|nr:hypothetical protein E3N88_09770 [Mikania micrantha]